VLLADTSYARIFVVAANAIEQSREVEGVKTKRHKMGGWSQARYQRHVDQYHTRHAKEVVDALTRIVRDEQIASVVVAGDEVIVPLLRDQFPKDVAERVVDTLRLDIRAPEREVLDTTVALMREKDAQTDRDRVESLVGAYRAGGLAVVGLRPTQRALDMGQVDELLLTARAGQGGNPAGFDERIAGELIAKARQTAASFAFIEDPTLLAPFGGVGAFLRFRL
jgi:peptide chain release factor subunit 1